MFMRELTKGCLSFLPPFTGARSCSMGCSLRVSMVQNSSSPFGSATPEDDRTAANMSQIKHRSRRRLYEVMVAVLA